MVPDDLTKAAHLFKGNLPHSVMLNTEYTGYKSGSSIPLKIFLTRTAH